MLLYLVYLTLLLEKKHIYLNIIKYLYIHPSTYLSKGPLKRETVI